MPSESSPRLPLAYEKGSPLTARDRSSDVLQSRTLLVYLNSVSHPERDIYLRLQIHDYTDPSVPAEVEAQAKPALGSRGCKVIKDGCCPRRAFTHSTHSACQKTQWRWSVGRPPNCVSLQVRTTTPRRPRGRRAAVLGGIRLVGCEAEVRRSVGGQRTRKKPFKEDTKSLSLRTSVHRERAWKNRKLGTGKGWAGSAGHRAQGSGEEVRVWVWVCGCGTDKG